MMMYKRPKMAEFEKEKVMTFLNLLVKHPDIKKAFIPRKNIREGRREGAPIFTLYITEKSGKEKRIIEDDEYKFQKDFYCSLWL